jgi:hypothetical protein
MRKVALLSATVVLLGAAAPALGQVETVQLLITGSYDKDCAHAIAAALGEVNEARIKTTKDNKVPVAQGKGKEGLVKVIVDIKPAKGDVGDLAKELARAKMPHKDKPAPTASLLLKAPSLTEENAKGLKDALKDVKGVDAEASRADPKTNEIHVRLAPKGGAKLADIQKALAEYTKKK